MQYHAGKRIAMLTLAGVLSACGGGGGGGGAKYSAPPPVRQSEYAGRVADENGQPLAGISILAGAQSAQRHRYSQWDTGG